MSRIEFTKQHSTDGFTLIEILVVVILAATLAAIAAPSWLAFVNRQRLSTATEDVSIAVRDAQSEAQRRRVSRSVYFRLPADPTAELPAVSTATPTAEGGAAPNFPGPLWRPLGGGEISPGVLQLNVDGAAGGVDEIIELPFDSKGNIDGGFWASVTLIQSGNLPRRCLLMPSLLGSTITLNLSSDADVTELAADFPNTCNP